VSNKEKIKIQNRKYYLKNRKRIIKNSSLYKKNNPQKNSSYSLKSYYKNKGNEEKLKSTRLYQKQYDEKNSNRKKTYKREYDLKNKSKNQIKENKRRKKRRILDVNFKIKTYLSSRLSIVLKKNKKSDRTIVLLGCSISDLKKHLESKFTDGMSLDNYGKWHIDHIVPCKIFDLSNKEAQKICFHYTNLQPLWGIDNIKKSSKVDFEFLKSMNVNPDVLKDKYKKILN